MDSEISTKTSSEHNPLCTTKPQTTTSKKKRKRKITDEDVPDFDVEYYDDEDKGSKHYQLAILKSLNAKHKEVEKRKQEDTDFKNPFNDIAENNIEKLAKEIYGGDKYDGEISKEDLKSMRDVLMEVIIRNEGKNDKESKIEKMVLENNIKLIDAEIKSREHLNKTGSDENN